MKYNFEYVKSFFCSNGCELLSTEYVDAYKTKLLYKCRCGSKVSKTFSSFKQRLNCPSCGNRKSKRGPYKSKTTIEDVKTLLSEFNCELLSKSYINSSTPLKYRCKCGNIVEKSFSSFKFLPRCVRCVGKEKYTYEEVKEMFKKRGCSLLSKEYENNNQSLDYVCSCGRRSKVRLRTFQSGVDCKVCGLEKSKKTQQKHYKGKIYFQTEEFKKNRAEANLKRYGVESISQVEEIKERKKETCLRKYGVESVAQVEEFKEKSKKTCLEKYGVEYCHQSEEVQEKFKNTLLKRYGVPSLAYLSRCASKESQKVFWEIFEQLSEKEKKKTYFAEHNGEFVKKQIGEKRYFKYDFVNSLLRKCIEYNGSKFHPKDDQKEDETGWCVFHPNKTIKEAREYEAIKELTIRNDGYDLLVVWDYEFKSDYVETLEKCMCFLKGD